MRSYIGKKINHLSDEEYLERELFRHWVIFTAKRGVRMGEQRQLKWEDISTEVEGGGKLKVWCRLGLPYSGLNSGQ